MCTLNAEAQRLQYDNCICLLILYFSNFIYSDIWICGSVQRYAEVYNHSNINVNLIHYRGMHYINYTLIGVLLNRKKSIGENYEYYIFPRICRKQRVKH